MFTLHKVLSADRMKPHEVMIHLETADDESVVGTPEFFHNTVNEFNVQKQASAKITVTSKLFLGSF